MLCHSRSSVKDLRLHCCVLKKEDAENQLNARHAVKMLCFGKGCHQPVSAITVHLTARLKSCFVAEHFQQEGNEWKDYFSALMWMVIFRQAGQDGVAYRDGSTKPRNTQAPKFLHLAKLLYKKKKVCFDFDSWKLWSNFSEAGFRAQPSERTEHFLYLTQVCLLRLQLAVCFPSLRRDLANAQYFTGCRMFWACLKSWNHPLLPCVPIWQPPFQHSSCLLPNS